MPECRSFHVELCHFAPRYVQYSVIRCGSLNPIDFVSFRAVSCRFVPFRVRSCLFVSRGKLSVRVVSCRSVSFRVVSCRVGCAISCRSMSVRQIPTHAALQQRHLRVLSCHSVSLLLIGLTPGHFPCCFVSEILHGHWRNSGYVVSCQAVSFRALGAFRSWNRVLTCLSIYMEHAPASLGGKLIRENAHTAGKAHHS